MLGLVLGLDATTFSRATCGDLDILRSKRFKKILEKISSNKNLSLLFFKVNTSQLFLYNLFN